MLCRGEGLVGKNGPQKDPGAVGGEDGQAILAPQSQSRQAGGHPLGQRGVVHKGDKFVERFQGCQAFGRLLQPPVQGGVVVLASRIAGEVAGLIPGIVGEGGHIHSRGLGTQRLRPGLRLRIHVGAQIAIGTAAPGSRPRVGPKGIKIQVKHLLKGGRRCAAPYFPK